MIFCQHSSGSLHLPVAVHESVPEVSDVLLPLVPLREPQHLTTAVEEASAELSLVQYTCALLRELTTGGGEGGREGGREGEREGVRE